MAQLISLFIVIFSVIPESHAFLDIRAVGMLNITDPTYKDSTGEAIGTHIRGGLGFGGIIGFKILPPLLALEGGVIFAQRKYALDTPQVDQSWNYFEIPIGVRAHLGSFNVTGGFFLSQGMGEVTDTDGQNNSSSAAYEKKNLSAAGLGLYVGAAYEFNSLFYSELRLAKDFKNHSTTGNELKFTNYEIMFGARLEVF